MPNSAIVGLLATGNLSYGTYVFDGAYHLSVEGENILDEAGRITIYDKYTLNVTAVIADAMTANVETRMQQIHDVLMQTGQILVMNQKGFNTGIDTSQQSGRDVNFGPKPKSFHWKQIGDSRAVEIAWSCEVCLAKCGGNRNTGVLGINYDIAVTKDRHGNTIRTISGYVLVANSVIGGAIENNPEIILPSIFKAPVPSHFYRETTRKFNYGKNRVDFTITDTEIGTNRPMNDFVTEISGSHNIHWGRSQGMQQMNTLSLHIVTRPDINPSQSYLIALDVFQQRIKNAQTGKGRVILLDIDVTEDIWGRASDVIFKWKVIGPVEDLIGYSGLWTPIITTNAQKSGNWDWGKWQTAMATTAFSPYGNAGWKLNTGGGDDVVVNLCSNTNTQSTVNGNTTYPTWPKANTYGYQNSPPDQNYSYLEYYMFTEAENVRPTASQSILQKPESEGGSVTMLDVVTGAIFSQDSGDRRIKNIIQQSSTSTCYVWLKGHAKRAGFAIPKPQITSIGGQSPVLIYDYFKNKQTANALGVPIFGAEWALKYAVPGIPSVLTAVANPAEGITLNNGYTLGSGTTAANPPQDVNQPGTTIPPQQG